MKKNRVNPRRVPATLADVRKAEKQATRDAVAAYGAIMLTALRDKEGFDYERLRRVWDESEYLADSIIKGYVDVLDLMDELKDNGIILDGVSDE